MIPLAAPTVATKGRERIDTLLESGTLSVGTVVKEFEDEFAAWIGRNIAVAVASGSVALELTLEATFNPGSRIALSPYNCGAMLYSILRTDLEPVFVDAEPETAALDPDVLADTDVDGVLVSHMFGHPAKMSALLTVADRIDATVVEDFAQAPGATIDGERVGSFGHVSVCSFGATKNLTTAEGGMVLTDDADLAERVGRRRTNTEDVTPPPRSVRMNDIEAAIGLDRLDAYDDIIERKRAVANRYHSDLDCVETMSVLADCTHVYHAFPVLTEKADALAAHLHEDEIGTNRPYETLLTEYEAAPPVTGTYPVATRLSEQVVQLPIHNHLSTTDVEAVVQSVRSFFTNQ